MILDGPIGNVIIADCTFQNNNGGALLSASEGNVSITNCTFQNNNAAFGESGGAVWLVID